MTRRAPTEPRKLPRQSRSKATVDAILTAAARVLVKDGYDDAGVNRIADVAGVSVGSLYQYFPSKEALVAALIRRHSEEMVTAFQENLVELAHLPMPDAVRGIVRRAARAYAVDPALRRVIVTQVPHTGQFVHRHEFDDLLEQMIVGYLVFHAAEIRPKGHALATKILITSIEAIVTRIAVEQPELLETEELVEEMSALILGYLGGGRG